MNQELSENSPSVAIDVDERSEIERRLTRLDRLAELMDDQLELPVIRTRVGLDPIIGLLPAGGDWVTWIVSAYIVWQAARMGAPAKLLLRMGFNTAVDLITGYVPVAGDAFDVVWKANRRNVELLKDHFGAQDEKAGVRLPAAPGGDGARVQLGASASTYVLAVAVLGVLLVLSMVPLFALWWYLQG